MVGVDPYKIGMVYVSLRSRRKESRTNERLDPMNFEIDKNKFKELVLYICARADREELGHVKLNKILWLSDVGRYVKTGAPITRELYIKQEFGPVANHLPPTLEELQAEHKLVIREDQSHLYPKKEYIALAEPDLSYFSAQEIDLVNQMIDLVCKKHTAESISSFSHNLIWQLAEIGEEIPYPAAFAIEAGEITAQEVSLARERIGKIS